MAAMAAPLPAGTGGCPRGPLSGTFMQLLDTDKTTDTAAWAEHLAELRALGIHTLYLQWLSYGDASFLDEAGTAMLRNILAAAEGLAMTVHLGLAADSGWWTAIDAPAEKVAPYLAGLRARSLALAQRALEAAGPSPALAGWYLPEEIDDVHWTSPPMADLLTGHLVASVRTLQELTPALPVAISGFVSGSADAEEFATLWRAAWSEVPFTLMLQDGQGVHALSEERLAPYMDAVSREAEHLGRRWAVVIELFEQLSGPPVGDGPFSARPAGFARLARQLRFAAGYPEAARIAFTARDYLLPQPPSGEPALAEPYRERYCRPQSDGPFGWLSDLFGG